MKKTVLLAIVAAFVLAPAVEAATYQGDTYWSLSGMWERTKFRGDDGGTVNATEINLGVEYFLSKELSVGPRLGYSRASGGFRAYDFGVDAKYHFMTDSNFVPYVGGFVDYTRIKAFGEKGSGLTYGPLGGIKMFVTQNTHVFVQYEYRMFTSDLKDVLRNQNAVLFGLAYKFN